MLVSGHSIWAAQAYSNFHKNSQTFLSFRRQNVFCFVSRPSAASDYILPNWWVPWSHDVKCLFLGEGERCRKVLSLKSIKRHDSVLNKSGTMNSQVATLFREKRLAEVVKIFWIVSVVFEMKISELDFRERRKIWVWGVVTQFGHWRFFWAFWGS